MNQLFASLFEHTTSQACLTDVISPTFAGITSAVAQINGSVNVSWSAATDATTPLTYAVYVKAGSAPNPGTDTPAVLTRALSAKIYVDGLQALLVKGTTYYFLVRAIDAVGNQDSNLVSMTAISAGVLTDDLAAIAASLAATEILLAADHVNFTSDHTNFLSDHSSFLSDHAAFLVVISNLQAQIDELETLINQLEDDIVAIDLIRLAAAIKDAIASTKSLLEVTILEEELEAVLKTDEIVAEIDEEELS